MTEKEQIQQAEKVDKIIEQDTAGDDYLHNLESDGYRVIDVIAGDETSTPEVKYIIEKVSEKKQSTFYSDIVHTLSSERFPESIAKQYWQEILNHKYLISEKLGRNVGIHVAALDYLENIKHIIETPKIVEETDFRRTLNLASIDPLTGLLNRRKIIERIYQEIDIAKIEKTRFCLLLTDLDGFKKFNDSEGHQAGDLILQEYATLLKKELRKQDVVGRYGGDEIIILLTFTDKFNACRISEKLRAMIESEFKQIGITLSIGLAEFPTDAESVDELIAEADELMYRAKEFGKNKVMYYVPTVFRYYSENKLKEVFCVGDFNRWSKSLGKMKFTENTKSWELQFNLKPGRYCYKFLVNGTEWILDPESAENVDDGCGGKCSVRRINP